MKSGGWEAVCGCVPGRETAGEEIQSWKGIWWVQGHRKKDKGSWKVLVVGERYEWVDTRLAPSCAARVNTDVFGGWYWRREWCRQDQTGFMRRSAWRQGEAKPEGGKRGCQDREEAVTVGRVRDTVVSHRPVQKDWREVCEIKIYLGNKNKRIWWWVGYGKAVKKNDEVKTIVIRIVNISE